MASMALSMAELRAMARSYRSAGRGQFDGISSAGILQMTKPELIARINGEWTGAETETAPKVNGGNGNGSVDLADAIAKALRGKIEADNAPVDIESINALVDEKTEALHDAVHGLNADMERLAGTVNDRMKAVVEEVGEQLKSVASTLEQRLAAAEKNGSREIVVTVPETGTRVEVGRQHRLFESILKIAALRRNVYMVGPAGSGKTSCAQAIAKALTLPFYSISVGLQTSQSQMIGYMDATGKYVRTALREAYEHGGIFLVDEIDAGNPNVVTTLNGVTSTDMASFPDGMVQKHPDFICFAAGNTFGRGADRQYVGRTQLDAATLNRFVVIDFDYDEDLETAISSNPKWTKRVQALRKAANDLKEKVVISPRASINGGLLLAAGFDRDTVEDMTIWQGVNPDVKSRIKARC